MAKFKIFHYTKINIEDHHEFDVIVNRVDNDAKVYERFKETLLSKAFSVKHKELPEMIKIFPYKHVLHPLGETAVRFLNYQFTNVKEGECFRICKQIIEDFKTEMANGRPYDIVLNPKMPDGSDRVEVIRYFALEKILPILEKYKNKLILPIQSPFIFKQGYRDELFEVFINLASDGQNEIVERFVKNEVFNYEVINFSVEGYDTKLIWYLFQYLQQLDKLRVANLSLMKAFVKTIRFDEEILSEAYQKNLPKPSYKKRMKPKEVSDELLRIKPALAESIVKLGLPKPTLKNKSERPIW